MKQYRALISINGLGKTHATIHVTGSLIGDDFAYPLSKIPKEFVAAFRRSLKQTKNKTVHALAHAKATIDAKKPEDMVISDWELDNISDWNDIRAACRSMNKYLIDQKIKDVAEQLRRTYGEEGKMQWRAGTWLSPSQAKKAMTKAGIIEYNAFSPNVFDLFSPDCKIFLAREYSVCIYVRSKLGKKLPSMQKLNASEYDIDEKTGFTRIWWD